MYFRHLFKQMTPEEAKRRQIGLHFHVVNLIGALVPALCALAVGRHFERELKAAEGDLEAQFKDMRERFMDADSGDFVESKDVAGLTEEKRAELIAQITLSRLAKVEGELGRLAAVEARLGKIDALVQAPRVYNLTQALVAEAAGDSGEKEGSWLAGWRWWWWPPRSEAKAAR